MNTETQKTQEQRQAEFDARVASGAVILGAVTIARGGKLHPAMMVLDDPAYPNGKLRIRCSCTGTSQGRAYNRATWYAGRERTCGRK
jgi:hypothetical protein